MKLLLTSNGLSNDSIANALEGLVGKPRKDIKVAFIPTAAFPEDDVKYEAKDWLVDDLYRIKEFCGFIDLVSLADLASEDILTRLKHADVIFVGGGNAFYLSYWMEKTGLFEELPELLETRVYAGISAGSMITTPGLRTASHAIRNLEAFKSGNFDQFAPKGRAGAKTAELVDFFIRPHFNRVRFPDPNGDAFESIAKDVGVLFYAIDDATAIQVIDDEVTIISEGQWKVFNG